MPSILASPRRDILLNVMVLLVEVGNGLPNRFTLSLVVQCVQLLR